MVYCSSTVTRSEDGSSEAPLQVRAGRLVLSAAPKGALLGFCAAGRRLVLEYEHAGRRHLRVFDDLQRVDLP